MFCATGTDAVFFPLLNECLVARQSHALQLFDLAVRGALSSPSYFTGLSYSNIRLANDVFCIDGLILGGLHHQNNISIKSKLKFLNILRSIWNKLKCIWFLVLMARRLTKSVSSDIH